MGEASSESGGAAASASPDSGPPLLAVPRKGKSCKGCLYYSSMLKSRGFNPVCVGIPRSIPQVPSYVVEEPREEAAAQGHDLRQFKYACAGYSMFVVDNRDGQGGEKDGKALLPYCQGLESPCSYWWTAEWLRENHRPLSKLQHMFQRKLPPTLGNKESDLGTLQDSNFLGGLRGALGWSLQVLQRI